jgi:hypothetical protein
MHRRPKTYARHSGETERESGMIKPTLDGTKECGNFVYHKQAPSEGLFVFCVIFWYTVACSWNNHACVAKGNKEAGKIADCSSKVLTLRAFVMFCSKFARVAQEGRSPTATQKVS